MVARSLTGFIVNVSFVLFMTSKCGSKLCEVPYRKESKIDEECLGEFSDEYRGMLLAGILYRAALFNTAIVTIMMVVLAMMIAALGDEESDGICCLFWPTMTIKSQDDRSASCRDLTAPIWRSPAS